MQQKNSRYLERISSMHVIYATLHIRVIHNIILLGWCKSSRGQAFSHRCACGVHDINVTFLTFRVKHWKTWDGLGAKYFRENSDNYIDVGDWGFKPLVGAWYSQWLTEAIWISEGSDCTCCTILHGYTVMTTIYTIEIIKKCTAYVCSYLCLFSKSHPAWLLSDSARWLSCCCSSGTGSWLVSYN